MSYTINGVAAAPVGLAFAGRVGYLRNIEKTPGADRDPRDGFVETQSEDGHYHQAIYTFPRTPGGEFELWTRELDGEGKLQAVSHATIHHLDIHSAEFTRGEDDRFVATQTRPDGRGCLDVESATGDDAAAGAHALGVKFDNAWWYIR